MKYSNTTNAARVRELLEYDPETGEFVWRENRRGGAKAGDRAGGKDSLGYIRISLDGVLYYAHRLAWLYVHGEFPNGDLDHINGDKADNRIADLRLANQSQNGANARRGKNNTSGLKGVYYRKDRAHLPNPWQAQIMKDRTQIYLGCFTTREDGHVAYVEAAARHFGEFARIS